MSRLLKPLSFVALLLGAVSATPSLAMEVRGPGGPPTLVVQVPDSAIVDRQTAQTMIVLAPNTLPILNLGTLPFDPAKIDLTRSELYPVLASDVLTNLAQSAGGTVTRRDEGSRVFIAGKSGYLFRGTIENQAGGDMSVEVALLMLDKAHVGLFALVSVQGKEAVGGLEAAMRAATVAPQ